jgi:hypothetical protein
MLCKGEEFVYDIVYYISEKMMKYSIRRYNFNASIQQTDIMSGTNVKVHYTNYPTLLLWKCDEVLFPNGCKVFLIEENMWESRTK